MTFDSNNLEVVVAPVFIHIASAKAMLNESVSVAAQNVSAHKNGAFTGEVSAEQIKDFGVHWAIIGHSERRSLFNETNEVVAQKVTRAQEAGLNTILCIGEQLAEREAGTTNEVLKQQLDAVKSAITDWSKIVIAYEPVWAIGTGKTASPEQAQETHAYVRSWLTDNLNADIAAATRIQYGGSANAGNAAALIS